MKYKWFEKKYLPQLFASTTGTLFAISDGMAFGWTAPFIPYLLSEKSHIATTASAAEWLEPAFLCGGLCGLPLTIYSVNNLGRKRSLLIAAATIVIAWTLTGLGNSMWHLFVARFMFGSAENMALVAAPMYISEIADQKIRGFLSSLIAVMVQLGVTLVYSVGPYTPYYVTPIIGLILGLTQLLVFPFIPETPYYYFNDGRLDEALKSLQFFKSYSDLNGELKEITETLEKQRSNRGRIRDLLFVKSNRKALFIMLTLSMGHHLSAYTSIMMNLHSILEAAGSTYMNTSQAAILFAILMLIATILCSFLVDNFGRKVLLTTSGVVSGICVLALAIYFHLKYTSYAVLPVSWIPIVSVMMFALSFKLGLGTIPVIVSSEVFPINLKAFGIVTGDLVYLLSGLCSLQVYQILLRTSGIHFPFYVFAVWSFLIVSFAYFYIPETKGKSFDEIQTILKGETSSEIEGQDNNYSMSTIR